MPNWCENTLRLIAKTDEARALLPRIAKGFDPDADDKETAFQVIYPTPAELTEREASFSESPEDQAMMEKYGARNWYEWRIANWGTKWRSDNYHTKLTGDTLIAAFSTAWSPPIGIYDRLVELGFDVFATYAEGGMGYGGVWDNGVDDEFQLIDPFEGKSEYPYEDQSAVLKANFRNVPQELRPHGLGG